MRGETGGHVSAAPGRRTRLAALAALAVLVAWAMGPVLACGFTNYDDDVYVTANPRVSAGPSWSGLAWALTTGHAANWHPLTWISHMLDVAVFGSAAWGHHLSGLALHVANTLLLFLLLESLTAAPIRSGLAAAWFGVHPLRVESVAWIAERKDVLSGLFWILATLAYVRWTRSPTRGRYVATAAFLALGLASKPMLVTLPITLLLLDYWPLGRWAPGGACEAPSRRIARLVGEKAPLFAMASASGIATFLVQRRGGAMSPADAFPPGVRAANAVTSYAAYLGKMAWPARLAAFYPHPGAAISGFRVAAAAALLAAATLLALALGRRFPFAVTGWLWYVVTLLPVIGLVQVGKQAMADRYTYVPSVGIAVLAAWGAPEAARSVGLGTRGLRILAAAAAAAILALGALSRAQAATWHDSITLFRHAIEAAGDSPTAHDDLGSALESAGRLGEAKAHYIEALRLDPSNRAAGNDLALALAREGRTDEAVALLERVLRERPGDPETLGNLGTILGRGGRLEEAVERLRAAVRGRPDSPKLRANLAHALALSGRTAEAIEEYDRAAVLDPADAGIRAALGAALEGAGRPDEAERQLAEAVRLDPRSATARLDRGIALMARKQWDDAAAELAEAARLDPSSARARQALGIALLETGRAADAAAEIEAARRLGLEPSPGLVRALRERGAAAGER